MSTNHHPQDTDTGELPGGPDLRLEIGMAILGVVVGLAILTLLVG